MKKYQFDAKRSRNSFIILHSPFKTSLLTSLRTWCYDPAGVGCHDHQNKLFAMIPMTLNGPWSSKPSAILSSFCSESLAFL